ncbi:4-amino-4-deoxychorismate lyase [Qingshengfaniella alkalisoli]|uniref:Probable branched-chain-amino-acid aminotransferase n=2 Tax=Qingshengfaniella alkalisoli TaxID=2599296 RepID=A0A5B8I8I4_9RHOB|nr:aminotransferase class IV family protein [Qingshengfaniella alkalisoli]QDY70315.1 4-amino-4-deoxychorismate lyase [Qingshengfaniella alkalisoli]
MGRWPGEGIGLLSFHMARLRAGAASLGYPFDADRVAAALVGDCENPQRLRLTLDATGEVEVTTASLPRNPPFWTVKIAEARLRSDDPWLGIKTTNRVIYDEARADLPPGVDEWLFLNERGELCEGTISNLFVVTADGRHVTPALSCGLLPGVLRQSLLQSGWREAVLTLDDLKDATEAFMGNSLRGLIPVRMAPIA